MTELTWFDHLVVHTGDIGGPPSLHPDVPQRTGELLVRRRLIEESIAMMRRLHLIELVTDGMVGFLYRATEESSGIVELLRSPYSMALKDRASWLNANILSRTRAELEELVAERIGRWDIGFEYGDKNSKALNNV